MLNDDSSGVLKMSGIGKLFDNNKGYNSIEISKHIDPEHVERYEVTVFGYAWDEKSNMKKHFKNDMIKHAYSNRIDPDVVKGILDLLKYYE